MTNQDCLDRAMFTAHESYSHTTYVIDDCGCGESGDYEESLMAKGKEPAAVLQVA